MTDTLINPALQIPQADLTNRFEYHPPVTPEIGDLHGDVRGKFLYFARWANKNLPPGRELSLAITKLEESMMWMNAAIARNQPVTSGTTTDPKSRRKTNGRAKRKTSG